MKTELKPNQVLFAKINDNAIIPTQRDEDAGYDLYATNRDQLVILSPHQTEEFPTGIASAFHPSKVALFKERGSTGKIGIGQRSGVMDSGYRGEWIVLITNHNDYPLYFVPDNAYEAYIKIYPKQQVYNLNKAIAQAVFLDLPQMKTSEVTPNELMEYKSERMTGRYASTNK